MLLLYSGVFKHIQAYLEHYVTVGYSEPYHMNPGTFKSQPYVGINAYP